MIQEGRDESLEKTTGGKKKKREKRSKAWRGKVTEKDEDLKVHHSRTKSGGKHYATQGMYQFIL